MTPSLRFMTDSGRSHRPRRPPRPGRDRGRAQGCPGGQSGLMPPGVAANGTSVGVTACDVAADDPRAGAGGRLVPAPVTPVVGVVVVTPSLFGKGFAGRLTSL